MPTRLSMVWRGTLLSSLVVYDRKPETLGLGSCVR